MKRFVWGIVLVSIAVFGFMALATNPDKPPNAAQQFVVGLMMAGGWGALIHFGRRSLIRRDHVMTMAFEQLRRLGHLDPGELAMTHGIRELEVREILRQEQVKGILPANVGLEMHASGEKPEPKLGAQSAGAAS